MRRLAVLLALLLVPSLARAVSVSGNLKDLSGGNVATDAFVRFTLVNTTGIIAIVSGTGAIAKETYDFYPDALGVISGTIYGNDVITPAGTYYNVCIYGVAPKAICSPYQINGSGTFDLNTAQALTTSFPTASTQTITGFDFVQTTPATTWTITHNLGTQQVQTQCFDTSWNLLTPNSLVNTDINTTTVTFATAETGQCVLQVAGPLIVSSGAGALALNPLSNQTVTGTYTTTFEGPLIANPFESSSNNIAQSGVFRLANNTDKICWRNAANSGDICIYVDNSNTFQIPTTTNIAGDLSITGNVSAPTGSISAFTVSTINGSPPATVSSVAMTGDGVVFKSIVPGSPITSSGTLAPALANANAGYVLAGPIGSLGTNIGIRQYVHCTFSTAVNNDVAKSFSCPAFSNPVIAGDAILVISPQHATKTGSSSFTDTVGTTLTNISLGGSGSTSSEVAYGTITTSGTDIVSGANIAYWDNGGSHSQYDFWAYEIVGSMAVNTATRLESLGSSNPEILTQATTPSASTDALIRLALNGSNNVATPSAGTFTFSPVGSTIQSFSSADIGMGFGATDFIAPGSTLSFTSTATWNFTAAPGVGGIQNLMVVDLTQSATSGSAPWVARRLQEGDLPASAVSAIQSVSKYNIASIVNLPSATNTTVISQSITMPSDGCPCRVFANYSGVEAVGGSGTVTSWISDGTNDGATMQADTTDATAMPINNEGWFGPYSNNQSVTFTWKVNPGTYSTGTYQMNTGFAAGTSSENGHMVLTVMQSRN